MKIKTCIVISVVFLFLINLFWGLIYKKREWSFQEFMSQQDLIYHSDSSKYVVFYKSSKQCRNLEFTYSGMKILNNQVFFGRDTLGVKSLSQAFKQPTLMFFFSRNTCSPCIDISMDCIKKVFPDFATNDRVVLVGSDLETRVKDSFFAKPVMSFVGGKMNIPIENYNVPFFFVLDGDGKLDMLFVPEKAFPEVTEAYLKIVKERFFAE